MLVAKATFLNLIYVYYIRFLLVYVNYDADMRWQLYLTKTQDSHIIVSNKSVIIFIIYFRIYSIFSVFILILVKLFVTLLFFCIIFRKCSYMSI